MNHIKATTFQSINKIVGVRVLTSRPVTVANDRISDVEYPTKPAFLDEDDIVGYNYVDRWLNLRELYYSIDKMAHPDWKMLGIENGATPSVRGRYVLPGDETAARPWGRGGNYNSSMVRQSNGNLPLRMIMLSAILCGLKLISWANLTGRLKIRLRA